MSCASSPPPATRRRPCSPPAGSATCTLSEQRFGRAAALGVVLAGFGAGSLAGLVAAGARPPRRHGAVLVAGPALIGAGTAALGFVPGLAAAAAVAAVIGVGSAYLGASCSWRGCRSGCPSTCAAG